MPRFNYAKKPLGKGYVSAKLVMRHVKPYIDKYERERGVALHTAPKMVTQGINTPRKFRDGTVEVKPMSESRVIAAELGVHHDTIVKYKLGHTNRLTFDAADKLLCLTVGPMAWHTDPALKRQYMNVNLAELSSEDLRRLRKEREYRQRRRERKRLRQLSFDGI